MAEITFSTMMSLDGFFQDSAGKFNWVSIDEEIHGHANDEARRVDRFVFGRRLYETMHYWDDADTVPGLSAVEREFATIWKRKPKLVFSRTLRDVGPNAQLATAEFGAELTRLKAQAGGLIEVGGPDLGAQAMRLDLIDSYRLYINPVILGTGVPTFKALPHPEKLRLLETRRFASGVVFVRNEALHA